MATLFIFEKQLECLHPPSRRSGQNYFCQDIRTKSILGSNLPDTPEGTWQGLEEILKHRNQDTTAEIVENLRPRDSEGGIVRLAYNLVNLDETTNLSRTLEFRGHEGTLNPERIVNWINVCAGLVEFADTVKDHLLDAFLRRHVDDQNFTVIDLLKAIGRPNEAEYYARKIQEYDTVISISSDGESPQHQNPSVDDDEENRRLDEAIRLIDAYGESDQSDEASRLDEEIRLIDAYGESGQLDEESRRLEEALRALEADEESRQRDEERRRRVIKYLSTTTDDEMITRVPLYKELST